MKAPILSYKCYFCGKKMCISEDLANVNHIYVHTNCLINDIEKQLKLKHKLEIIDLQECYDLAMKEINRLRKKLKYD